MSGICGVVRFDGEPIDRELLCAMTEASQFRGPDGIGYWFDGSVGFSNLALNNTPESVRERQPLVKREGALCLTADARVDNRPELIAMLGFEAEFGPDRGTGHQLTDRPTHEPTRQRGHRPTLT